MSTIEAKKIAEQYANYLRSNNFTYKQIFLFGSFAIGNPHKWSDIDVAVISDEFAGDDWLEKRFKLWDYVRKVDSRIEPLGLSPEEFRENLSPMVSEIKEHGIRIE